MTLQGHMDVAAGLLLLLLPGSAAARRSASRWLAISRLAARFNLVGGPRCELISSAPLHVIDIPGFATSAEHD